MSKIKVRCTYYGSYGFHDWNFVCHEHGVRLTTDSWKSAYEAAMGHVAMHHPTPFRNPRRLTADDFHLVPCRACPHGPTE